jgi:hypothetical protein
MANGAIGLTGLVAFSLFMNRGLEKKIETGPALNQNTDGLDVLEKALRGKNVKTLIQVDTWLRCKGPFK